MRSFQDPRNLICSEIASGEISPIVVDDMEGCDSSSLALWKPLLSSLDFLVAKIPGRY